jgi:hypothetical protein
MRKHFATLLSAALLADCTVGPRYEAPPDMATPVHFDPEALCRSVDRLLSYQLR